MTRLYSTDTCTRETKDPEDLLEKFQSYSKAMELQTYLFDKKISTEMNIIFKKIKLHLKSDTECY